MSKKFNWKDCLNLQNLKIAAYTFLMLLFLFSIYVLIMGDCTTLKKLCASAGSSEPVSSIGTVIERIGYSVGGLVALLLAIASFERVRALDKTADAQNKVAEAQNETAKAQNKTVEAQEKGNVEERYKNAVEQLSNREASIRLAGAYGLYHLARDNGSYRKSICDVLCAYIRNRTTGVTEKALSIGFINIDYKDKHNIQPSNDVQSILDLLTKEQGKREIPFNSEWIDLSEAFLKGANLVDAILGGARLGEVNFEGAYFFNTNLKDAKLEKSSFEGAVLYRSDLEKAHLRKVSFKYADLLHVENLEKAELLATNFEHAYSGEATTDELLMNYEKRVKKRKNKPTDINSLSIPSDYKQFTQAKIDELKNKHNPTEEEKNIISSEKYVIISE